MSKKKHPKGTLATQIKDQLEEPALLDRYYSAIVTPLKVRLQSLRNEINSSRIHEKRANLNKKARKAGRKEINRQMMNLYKYKFNQRFMYAVRVLFKGNEYLVFVFKILVAIWLFAPFVVWLIK